MSFKSKNGRGKAAFDAAASSSLAFLSSELEYSDPTLVKPLTSMTHPRDIDVEFGGGFIDFISQYASDYASTGGNTYGLQGTNNTDINNVSVNVTKGVWQAYNWAQSFVISWLDLKKLQSAKKNGQPAPIDLESMLEDGVKLVWSKALERVVYNGWLGQPGIINNPNVTSALVPATGAGGLRTWASKTAVQIQLDINTGISQTVTNSAYSLDGMADTMLIPWTQYNLLTAPMTTGGFSSIMEYVLNNNIAKQNGIDFKIFPLANDWISGIGAGSTDRAVFYRNNKKNVKLRIPQPIIRQASAYTTRSGGAYETIYNGCIGQVQFLRTQPFYYEDGI